MLTFYNQRGTAEKWIKEGKGAIKWTRLSCRTFCANAVRLQLHVLAYNLGNFMRTLAMPKAAQPWSLTSLLAADVCRHPVADRPATGPTCAGMTRALVQMRRTARGEVCADLGKRGAFCVSVWLTAALIVLCLRRRRFAVAQADQKRDPGLETAGIWRMSDQALPHWQLPTVDNSEVPR